MKKYLIGAVILVALTAFTVLHLRQTYILGNSIIVPIATPTPTSAPTPTPIPTVVVLPTATPTLTPKPTAIPTPIPTVFCHDSVQGWYSTDPSCPTPTPKKNSYKYFCAGQVDGYESNQPCKQGYTQTNN